MGSSYADKVCLSLFNNTFHHVLRYPFGHHHWNLHRLFHAFGQIDPRTPGRGHALVMKIVVRFPQAGRDVDTVHASLFQGHGNHPGINVGHPSGRMIVIAVNPHQDRIVLTAAFLYFFDHLATEPDSPFHPSVLVCPRIQGWREKCARQISVGIMDLHGVKACLFGPQGTFAKLFDGVLTFKQGQSARFIIEHLCAGSTGTGDGLGTADFRTGLSSGVHDL